MLLGRSWRRHRTWAPNGTHFFFHTNKEGRGKLAMYDAETGAITTVMSKPRLPTFDREGKTMAWEVNGGGVSELWLIDNFR